MSNTENKANVTLEDLLRLKKTERPAADFWMNFERELRQKQLSALVEKRSWWQALPQVFFARRVYLPIGATAILTFTLVSMRLYSPNAVVPAVPVPLGSSPQQSREVISDSAITNSPLANRHEQIAKTESPVVDPVAPEKVVTSTRASAPVIVASDFDESPSARSIAANFARLQQSEPELINSVLGARLSSPARVQTSSQPTVELASLAVNTSKRIRLVAHYNDRHVSAEPVASEDYRERLSRRLGDSEINDRLSRIGLKGDQFSLKF